MAARNVSVTASCGLCGEVLPAGRTRSWCSASCRQAAWRRRQAAPRPALAAKVDTVYECPDCETRYLGEQRCPECNRWCRKLGAGAPCPHCEEFVAVSDLVTEAQLNPGPLRSR